MVELPDVNVLYALHDPSYHGHREATEWFDQVSEFATTPITESALVRLMLNPEVGQGRVMPTQAWMALDRLRTRPGAVFWPDGIRGVSSRFRYAVTGHRQVTDIHLLELVRLHEGRLVKLDKRIVAALKPSDRKLVHILPTH